MAHAYDDIPYARELTGKIADAILRAHAFDAEQTTVLEFACGTGLVSAALAPHAKQIVGVDISQGMVDQYNLRFANQGVSPDKIRAVCLELTGAEGELGGQKFDVAVCTLAYHHFSSIEAVTCTIAAFLKPCGALLVADFTESGAPDASMGKPELAHAIAHENGIAEPSIHAVFDTAGLQDFYYHPCVHVATPERELNVFIARGVKPIGTAV
ncbi:S-adenosyl-L-methionine-dependent methyltransferase [Phellopilus nigrolimitatus]|nr:S-adenosyl-L-methionine-dependent methyltransferase [Phellopilus nigrolimitatus]